MAKELLFSVTAADCHFDYIRGSGPGGQKKNKTSSAVRCHHIASGAIGYAEDTRSQHKNKQLAFERMALSDKFKKWHKFEIARRTGKLEELERTVDREMQRIRVENKQDGRWTEVDKNDPLTNQPESGNITE